MLYAAKVGIICSFICFLMCRSHIHIKCNNQAHTGIICLQSLVILLEPAYFSLHFFMMTLKVRFLKALRCLILLKSMGDRCLSIFEELAL